MRLFKRKPKSYLLENKYRIAEAFKYEGKSYFWFEDQFQLPTGRGMAALSIYEELRMRCSYDYLLKHCKAIEILLSDPKKININQIAIIHNNLKERLSLVPFPDYIYKLASVTYFDESESPYSYDWNYNKKKIAGWKASGGMLDFFLTTPLRELIPFMSIAEGSAESYFQVSEEVDKMHQSEIQQALSRIQ